MMGLIRDETIVVFLDTSFCDDIHGSRPIVHDESDQDVGPFLGKRLRRWLQGLILFVVTFALESRPSRRFVGASA